MTIVGVPADRYFYKKPNFTVEIAGVTYAGFTACSPIQMDVAVIEHYEGGAQIPSKQPGRVTVPNVTLTRGATDDHELYDWFQKVAALEAGLVDPGQKRTLDVVARNRLTTELRRWTLVAAWPVQFIAGDWDNNADEAVVETLVLAYDYPVIGGD